MEKQIFVIELGLKTEKWQEDILDKRYELLRKLYNGIQRILLRNFKYLEKMNGWKGFKNSKYACKGKKIEFLLSHPFKVKGFEKPVILIGEKPKSMGEEKKKLFYAIPEFVEKYAKKNIGYGKTYSDFGLNTTILNSLGRYIWSAWDKKLFGDPIVVTNEVTKEQYIKQRKIHFKKYNDLNTIYSRKKSGYITGFQVDLENMNILFNINGKQGKKNKKVLTLPIIFNKPTEYEKCALKNTSENNIKTANIVRKVIRGKNKYYIQLTIEGKKPQKGRTLGVGNVGLDLGTSTIAASSDKEVSIDILASECEKIDKDVAILERKMERSRRINNPDNYNEEDGTIKKGRLKWNNSNRYNKLREELKEKYRKQREIKKLSHIKRANSLLHLGNKFIIEQNNVKGWSKRSKGIRKDKNGKICSNKRYGKSVGEHAPATFKNILKLKVESLGGVFVEVDCKNAATQYDFTDNTYKKHAIDERFVTLSNGDKHQRDMLSAFNLQHLNTDSEVLKTYETKKMINDYDNFCALEKIEIDKYKNKEKISNSSIGIK